MQTNAPATAEWVDQFNRAVTFQQVQIDQAITVPAHAATHAVGGSDPVSAASIGAASTSHASTHATGGSDAISAASIGASSYAVYTFTHSSWSPGASGTTGYMGFPVDVTPPTTAATRSFGFPYNATVVGASLVMSCTAGTVQGAGAAIALYNKTTASSLGDLFTTGLDYTSTGGGLVTLGTTGLNYAVSAGSTYAIRLIIPTFTSAPTSVKHGVYLFFR